MLPLRVAYDMRPCTGFPLRISEDRALILLGCSLLAAQLIP